jgi:hypothetical protein
LARHGIHLAEVLEVSAHTLGSMQKCQAAVYDRLRADVGHTYVQQASDYADFQVQTLRNLTSRSHSNNQRLQNEITLV